MVHYNISILTFCYNDINNIIKLIDNVYGVAEEIIIIDSSKINNHKFLLDYISNNKLQKIKVYVGAPTAYYEPLRMYGINKCKNDCAGTAPMYFAYSKKDGEARWGHRTPSKKEQILYKTTRGTKCQKNDNAKRYKQNNLFYGYKPHIIIDAETEISIAIEILPANTNDKKLFDQLYAKVKKIIVLQYQFKFLADVKAIIKNDNGTLYKLYVIEHFKL